jgi:NAD-dependent deacetylase
VIDEARHRIAVAARTPGGVAVLTGAGMSAESGIATFRDAVMSGPEPPSAAVPRGKPAVSGRPGDGGGLWSRFDPAQLASEEGFRADPARVWAWYAERREGVRAAQPNAGHHALAAFAQKNEHFPSWHFDAVLRVNAGTSGRGSPFHSLAS